MPKAASKPYGQPKQGHPRTAELTTKPAVEPRLVSTNLQRAYGSWIRLCPAWYGTGLPAHWTSIEARRSGTWA